MAPITWNDVITIPGAKGDGLQLVDSTAQTAILASVNKYLDVNMYDGEDGADTHLARCYLAAHFCALGKIGAGGALTAEGDGRLNRQYAIPTTRSQLLRTSYGTVVWELAGVRAKLPVLLGGRK